MISGLSFLNFSKNKLINIGKRFLTMKRFTNIKKPSEDTRLFRGLKLENGLSVLLISDHETDSSAAALSVHSGAFLDPKNMQGLAHFLEHMLFMGTKKYPSENEYSKYLSQNAGNSNAYTNEICTTYFFDVSPDNLQPALDRFVQFFIDPLMLADSVTRELEAVHSEYQQNKENDFWRETQVLKFLGDQKHDFSKFLIGNLETLRDIPQSNKINVRNELFKFHEQWYSANIMYLVVLGKESLDELEKMVEPMFKPILNRNIQCKTWDNPFKPEHLMKTVSIVPIRDKRTMSLNFVYPDETKYYKSGPGHYISHLIGHEGYGSLLTELKELGLVSGLSACIDSTDGFGTFNISLDLTEEGLKNTDEIAKHVFQYINLLKEKGPQEYIYNELKELSSIKFNFMEKQNPIEVVEKYSAKMHYYPIEEIISANCILEEYRPDLIKEMLSYLNPENCIIILSSKTFEGKTDQVEYFFDVKYKVEPFSEKLLNNIKNAGLNSKYFLSPPNELIPTDFKIFSDKKDESKTIPEKIYKNDILDVWFLQDWIYLKPKVYYSLRMANPINLKCANSSNCHGLFSMLFTDSLTEYLYDARLACLSFDISQNDVGFNLSFYGYNHKMKCFFERILERLVSYEIDPNRFAILREKFQRFLKNYKAQQLYKLVNYYNGLIIYENVFTYEERIAVLDQLTLDNVQQYWREFVKDMHVDLLIYGNIDRPNADSVVDLFQEKFLNKCQTKPLAEGKPRIMRQVTLPAGKSYLYQDVNEIQSMKAILNHYQVGTNFSDRCALFLIDQILNESFFNYLRTKEQLGYIALSKYHQNFGVHGLQFIIQSQFGTEYLDKRIEAFLAWSEKDLEEMSQEEFDKEKSSLITRLMKKKKQMYHFVAQLNTEIERQEFDFERKKKLVDGIKLVSKKDVLQVFRNNFNRDGSRRQKLSIRINRDVPEENKQEPNESAKQGIFPEVVYKPPVLIDDHKSFKSSLELFPRTTEKIQE